MRIPLFIRALLLAIAIIALSSATFQQHSSAPLGLVVMLSLIGATAVYLFTVSENRSRESK